MTRRTPAERFWEKVSVPDANGCMDWTASTQARGYGSFWDGQRLVGAHVFSYVLAHGPIPCGYDVDHSCRRPVCVAPAHLEAVTHLENVRRGRASATQKARHAARTACKNGHAFTPDNTRVNQAGARVCRTCERAYLRRWRAARRSS